jgi:hypothetical protein
LAEYINWSTRNIIITKEERTFIKKYYRPPDNWSIFYASLNGPDWTQKYVKDYLELHIHSGSFESPILLTPPNTQITSFGMGKLFVQIFTCPVERAVTDYRIAAKSKGLSQLWPIRSGFYPFTKGSAKFPAKCVFNDEEANVVAHAFFERTKGLLRSAHERGQPLY